jgi:hypothetical protein
LFPAVLPGLSFHNPIHEEDEAELFNGLEAKPNSQFPEVFLLNCKKPGNLLASAPVAKLFVNCQKLEEELGS